MTTTKIDRARKIHLSNPDLPRPELVKRYMKELDMTRSCANVYAHMVLKENDTELPPTKLHIAREVYASMKNPTKEEFMEELAEHTDINPVTAQTYYYQLSREDRKERRSSEGKRVNAPRAVQGAQMAAKHKAGREEAKAENSELIEKMFEEPDLAQMRTFIIKLGQLLSA